MLLPALARAMLRSSRHGRRNLGTKISRGVACRSFHYRSARPANQTPAVVRADQHWQVFDIGASLPIRISQLALVQHVYSLLIRRPAETVLANSAVALFAQPSILVVDPERTPDR